jgi:hypothetical protein
MGDFDGHDRTGADSVEKALRARRLVFSVVSALPSAAGLTAGSAGG